MLKNINTQQVGRVVAVCFILGGALAGWVALSLAVWPLLLGGAS